jgi:hypothetical protein
MNRGPDSHRFGVRCSVMRKCLKSRGGFPPYRTGSLTAHRSRPRGSASSSLLAFGLSRFAILWTQPVQSWRKNHQLHPPRLSRVAGPESYYFSTACGKAEVARPDKNQFVQASHQVLFWDLTNLYKKSCNAFAPSGVCWCGVLFLSAASYWSGPAASLWLLAPGHYRSTKSHLNQSAANCV